MVEQLEARLKERLEARLEARLKEQGGACCAGCAGGMSLDATLCSTLNACTSSNITKAMLRLPKLAEPFKNAVSAINAAIARGTKEDRDVIVEFAAKVYAELTRSQRQRLDDPMQWNANDSIVMNLMFVIIPEMDKWKIEYGM
jgi:hypothetical protein